MTRPFQMGWDIGGANLKAVVLTADGMLQQALQVACPLWKGLNQLQDAAIDILDQCKIEKNQLQHAVTMTGELVDLFQNRRQGVLEIATLFAQIAGQHVRFYAAQTDKKISKFVTLTEVSQYSDLIASANWHASASLIAKSQPQALLVDIGTTTTDIVPIIDGDIAGVGFSDARRMQQDALVYTGVVRTPIMALSQTLMVNGITTNVAAEYFATMADVYRLTGELEPQFDSVDTADGQDKTKLASARRLARMVGHDFEDKPRHVWEELAQTCKTLQLQRIKSAMCKFLNNDMPIIGAGAGAFLVEQLAAGLEKPYISLPDMLKLHLQLGINEQIAQCLPAYAVAWLCINEQ